MTYPGDGGFLKSYPDSFINLYMSRLNPSLVCTIGKLVSSWSKCLEEVTTLGKGRLVILLTTSTSFSPKVAQLTLSMTNLGCFKVVTICSRVSLGTLKICGPI